ncbi:hypothetical protein GF402_05485 [Candidatus Fermentibacteria bacterium]|nr:hypothetical protein [Candidatus Fermentibacteria bacterium]
MAALTALGALGFFGLPWSDQSFQVSALSVGVYFFWSLLQRRESERRMDLANGVTYMVLLISVLDGFLVEMTVFDDTWWLRWAGLGILSAGVGWCMVDHERVPHYVGRVLLLMGFPLGLGSISGAIAGALAAILILMMERPEPEGEEKS